MAFGSLIVTQLAQTVQSGGVNDTLSAPVLGAVGGSGAVLALSLAPPVRGFLHLPATSASSPLLIAGTAPAAMALASRLSRTSAPSGHAAARARAHRFARGRSLSAPAAPAAADPSPLARPTGRAAAL